ncbi:MAG: hypothetical protein EBQ80_00680 [Proteobacteria bacterium]|nr:hypothetical protein [Pseudomonadota bacterium]
MDARVNGFWVGFYAFFGVDLVFIWYFFMVGLASEGIEGCMGLGVGWGDLVTVRFFLIGGLVRTV